MASKASRPPGTYERQFAILLHKSKPAKGDSEWDKLRKAVMRRMHDKRHTFTNIKVILGCSYSNAYDWITGAKEPRASVALKIREKYLEQS